MNIETIYSELPSEFILYIFGRYQQAEEIRYSISALGTDVARD